jgi:hypothetical protein
MSFDVRWTRRWSMVTLGAACGAALVVTAATGCKKEHVATGEVLSAAPEGPAVDPALARAIATASASAKVDGPAADGPPESGVFGPGEADRQLARGAPAKLTVGELGAAPRVKIAPLPASPKGSLRVRVSAQRGNNQEVPIDVELALEVGAAKAPAAEAAAGPLAAVAAPLTPVVAKVASAKVDTALVSGVNQGVSDLIGKLKGSRIEFQLAPTGAGTGFAVTLPKGADPALGSMLNSLSDVLAMITMPYPTEPVGVGGMWMATTREAVLGIDTVSYRLMKVQSVAADRATLEVHSRRYAADAHQVVPGITAEGAVDLQQFKAEGTGVVEVPIAGGLPDTGNVQYGLAVLVLTGAQPRPMLLQEQVRFVLGTPALAAAAAPMGPDE